MCWTYDMKYLSSVVYSFYSREEIETIIAIFNNKVFWMFFWIKNIDEKTHYLFIIKINKKTKGYTFVATEIVVSI